MYAVRPRLSDLPGYAEEREAHDICFAWTPAGPERVEVTDYH